jgi:hypothetical protein
LFFFFIYDYSIFKKIQKNSKKFKKIQKNSKKFKKIQKNSKKFKKIQKNSKKFKNYFYFLYLNIRASKFLDFTPSILLDQPDQPWINQRINQILGISQV